MWALWLGLGLAGAGLFYWVRERQVAARRRFRSAAHDLWAALSYLFDPEDRGALSRLVEQTPWPDEWWGNETNRKVVRDLAKSALRTSGHSVEASYRELKELVEGWGRNALAGGWGLRQFLGGERRDYHQETLKLYWYLSASGRGLAGARGDSPAFDPVRRLRDLID